MAKKETLVKVYKNTKEYEKDAKKLAASGWEVSNVTERQPRSGCARGCLLGLMALVWRPKPELVITYVREIAE